MRHLPIVLALVGAFSFAGCENNIQTTSGAEYLSSYPVTTTAPDGTPVNVVTDDKVRAAAAVEPILRFPARIGIARIDGKQIAGIPSDEMELWAELAEQHEALGEFVPISPIIAEFTAEAVGQWRTENVHNRGVGELVTTIRLGAARQHVDAVLIYGVTSSSRKSNTPLAFADLSVIGGAILPTRALKAQGIAHALLLDVRNGYPYGTASAHHDLSGYSISFGSDERNFNMQRRASLEVVGKLTDEVEEMFAKLKVAMAKRLK